MIEGDFAKLEAIVSAAGNTTEVREEIAKHMAKWIEERIEKSFDDHEDPYGNVWAPRKSPTQRHPLLDLTGNFKGSFHVTSSELGIAAVNLTSYAGYLQWGNENMPPRKTLPEEEYDSLGEWGEPLIEIALNALRKSLEEKGL